jgi:hypothetical protein
MPSFSAQIVIVGGGWAGCAAALSARRQGAYPILIERTDMPLGTGLVGGIMRNNGRYTATEELIAMGGGDLFKQIDGNLLHRDIEFPGHHHAALYNVGTMEAVIHRYLIDNGGDIRLQQKMAICTMVQSQQSFSTFMFCIISLTAIQAKVFVVVLLSVFAPLVVVPLLMRLTLWRDTRPMPLDEMPRFTPDTGFLPTIFGAAREGAELLFLLIIPAVGVIFALIGDPVRRHPTESP